jgi:predicted negative regulator of RcsB-dependent stress response
MNPELLAALAIYAVKYGIEAAIELGESRNLDEALRALRRASQKTAQEYLREARSYLYGTSR